MATVIQTTPISSSVGLMPRPPMGKPRELKTSAASRGRRHPPKWFSGQMDPCVQGAPKTGSPPGRACCQGHQAVKED